MTYWHWVYNVMFGSKPLSPSDHWEVYFFISLPAIAVGTIVSAVFKYWWDEYYNK